MLVWRRIWWKSWRRDAGADLRSVIIYICVLVVVRLMGKRQVGEMQPFEFVITLIIADLACIPMAELSVPLVHGIVPILTLLILHFLICFLARKFVFARYLLTGKPAIVISPRGINYKELRELNMTLDDLMELVRTCSVFNLSEIAYAIIETNGNLCVIKKSECEPPTREDFKVKVSQNISYCFKYFIKICCNIICGLSICNKVSIVTFCPCNIVCI